MNKKVLFYLGFFLILVGGFFYFLFAGTDHWKAKLATVSYVQPFSFINQDNQTVTEDKLKGKVNSSGIFFYNMQRHLPKNEWQPS